MFLHQGDIFCDLPPAGVRDYCHPFRLNIMQIFSSDKHILQSNFDSSKCLGLQLFFELSEFQTYRVGFFRIVGKIRAYKITACSGKMCEITSYGVFTCSTKHERECKTITLAKII